jgi:hypothetical protein
VIEIKGRNMKKGRVNIDAPDKPTSNGNCISWDFIVGKIPQTSSEFFKKPRSLLGCNNLPIHKLFTVPSSRLLDKLWAICGVLQIDQFLSHIVVLSTIDISEKRHQPADFIQKCWLVTF